MISIGRPNILANQHLALGNKTTFILAQKIGIQFNEADISRNA